MDGEWEPPVIQNPEYKVRLGVWAGGGDGTRHSRGWAVSPP